MTNEVNLLSDTVCNLIRRLRVLKNVCIIELLHVNALKNVELLVLIASDKIEFLLP